MAEDMSDLINNVKNMVDSGNIPDNIKEMLNGLNSNSSSSKEKPNNSNANNSTPDISSLLSSFMNNSQGQSENENNNSNSGFNIDMETILKMKNIIDSMNSKDDPRANLLYSLKPYLRESRKNKLDQYVNMLNMTKIAEFMKKENGNNA